jgi:hypothetical protein
MSVPGMVKSAGIVQRMIENETSVDTVDHGGGLFAELPFKWRHV